MRVCLALTAAIHTTLVGNTKAIVADTITVKANHSVLREEKRPDWSPL